MITKRYPVLRLIFTVDLFEILLFLRGPAWLASLRSWYAVLPQQTSLGSKKKKEHLTYSYEFQFKYSLCKEVNFFVLCLWRYQMQGTAPILSYTAKTSLLSSESVNEWSTAKGWCRCYSGFTFLPPPLFLCLCSRQYRRLCASRLLKY